MFVTDPIGDMIARIRNAQMRGKPQVCVPASRFKRAVLDALVREGYVQGYDFQGDTPVSQQLIISLKYYQNKPVIRHMKRVSKPSVRMYTSVRKMPEVANGLGTALLSTPLGVLSDREARAQNVGGKILLTVR
jgi:small subunit ribosomal protein S8